MRSSHLPWLKKEPTTNEIDLENLFNIYWTSKAQQITVPGQSWSPIIPLILMEQCSGRRHWEA